MDQRMTADGDRDDRGERGFTMVEVLIALLILLVGMAGVLSLQLTSLQATAFSRHATEASVLAEDKMEALRTEPLVSNNDRVDARGVPDPAGLYVRQWTVTPAGENTLVTVEVTWVEQGNASEPYSITMSTLRTP